MQGRGGQGRVWEGRGRRERGRGRDRERCLKSFCDRFQKKNGKGFVLAS